MFCSSQHYSHWRRYTNNPVTGRNIILASFCPDLHQLYIVKLATLLVILGGVPHKDGRGTKVRAQPLAGQGAGPVVSTI